MLPHLRERMSTAELTDIGQRFLVARAEHLGDQPDDMTKADLEQQAADIDLAGASIMRKDQLQGTLEESAAV